MKKKETSKPLAGSLPVETGPEALRTGDVPQRAANVAAARDRIVLLSMGVVTAAISAMLYTQFAVSASTAILVGAGAWALFMMVHQQVRKGSEIARLKSEVHRLELQLHGAAQAPDPTPQMAAGATGSALGGRPAASRAVRPPQPPQQRDVAPNLVADPEAALAAPKLEAKPRWEPSPQRRRAPAGEAMAGSAEADVPREPPRLEIQPGAAGSAAPGHGASGGPVIETALWPGTSLATDDPMRDQWAFRPRNEAVAQGLSTAGSMPAPTAGEPVSTIEADLAMVQSRIKALAEEVNAAEASRGARAAVTEPPGHVSADVIDQSVGALRATAAGMRDRRYVEPPPIERGPQTDSAVADRIAAAVAKPAPGVFGELEIPASAEPIAVSAPPSAAPHSIAHSDINAPFAPASAGVSYGRGASAFGAGAGEFDFVLPPVAPLKPPVPPPNVRAIANAIEAGRMDLFLSPIVSLGDHAVTHYEVNIRLKAASGAYVDHTEDELLLAGDELVAMFDVARLTRAAALANLMAARGKSGSVLSEVAGPSLTNARFLETFAGVYEERVAISQQLVLTMSQATVEAFSPSAWEALGDMHAFGFRFALDRVAHMRTDFAELARRGFVFVKLDASVLLRGLATYDRFIPSDEVCKTIASSGLALVASGIQDETTSAKIFGFGVLLGQGQLFGAGRQINLPPTAPKGHSAAA